MNFSSLFTLLRGPVVCLAKPKDYSLKYARELTPGAAIQFPVTAGSLFYMLTLRLNFSVPEDGQDRFVGQLNFSKSRVCN